MPKTYLVTGGSGFIGRNVAMGLARTGAKVISFDNNWRSDFSHSQSRNNLSDLILDSIRTQAYEAQLKVGAIASESGYCGSIEEITGDIRDAETVQRAMEGVDCVCHLAYINGTNYFYSHPEVVLDVGVKGMVNILDACQVHGVKDLVLASSSEVYQNPPMVPTLEDVPLIVPDVHNPRYSYGGGKIICELMAINYGRAFFDRVRVIRPHNIYGPQMGWEHVVPQFITRLHRLSQETTGTIPFPIQGTGEETRAFCYISDMVDAWITITDKGEHLGIYNVGTCHEITISTLAREIAALMNLDIEIIPGDIQPGGTSRRCPSIEKAQALGYEPRVSLREGLENTVRWYLANRPPVRDTQSGIAMSAHRVHTEREESHTERIQGLKEIGDGKIENRVSSRNSE